MKLEQLLFDVLKTNGLSTALVVAAVWFFHKLYIQQTDRLAKLEDWIRDQFSQLISSNTHRLEALEDTTDRLDRTIENAPCGRSAHRDEK